MTAASDLDLIMLYDYAARAETSDGEQPLGGIQYYGRLTQRLVAALSAPTAEGILYEVDFRLRPSGHSGPLATHIDSFHAYQQRGAWTWEHMALTRARAIAGDQRLIRRARREIGAALNRRRERARVLRDVVEMRAMVEDAKGDGGMWDIKQAPGGLVDIEFVAQAFQLIHLARHPQVHRHETAEALRAIGEAGLIDQGRIEKLTAALRLYQSLIQILRLCVEDTTDIDELPRGLRERLVQAAELPDFATLEAHLRDTQASVRGIFVDLVGDPAAAAKG